MTNSVNSIPGNTGHGGNIHLLSRNLSGSQSILDFSANINPIGPPSWLRRIISRNLSDIVHYPDPDCHAFIQAIIKRYKVNANMIVPANGTTELLYQLPTVLSCSRAIIPVPSYIDYQKVMELHDIEVVQFPLLEENNFQLDANALSEILTEGDAVMLGSPNNPTATVIDSSIIIDLALKHRKTWFIVDEAFLEFIENCTSVAGAAENIITLHSLTKFYAIPGLRLGFGIFPEHVAAHLIHIMPPWSVNSLAQSVGSRVFDDVVYRETTLQTLKTLRENFFASLNTVEQIKVFPSSANYFLIKIKNDHDANELYSYLLNQNIAIRVCSNYQGLDKKYFRVAVRTERENQQLTQALVAFFNKGQKASPRLTQKKKSLMIQGTSSNAGKSVLVAALCRILVQDGLRVAPFKAQNMSLNSFVTLDGLEMGRAQVVQAQAAKLDPDVRMNPVLLKPNSDVGSQVIVHGKPVGNMTVTEYIKYKDTAARLAHQSYDQLRAEYDAVILEGAGSPGEVNLKHHDIVNMNMAKYAHSPVLLVGDIDRGGVYASFIGTMEVLDEWERNLVAGFLVNRFRGDATLLQPAHEYLLEHTGKPVFGTIPYIHDLGIPEEDSVSFKDGKLQKSRPHGAHVEIALINMPHISNFTDIEPFLDEPDVYLKIVNSPADLNNPEAIILPGSKNVIGDLTFLRRSGLAETIIKKAQLGCGIVGICGGYQILGKIIRDPHSIESDNGQIQGLGILDIETTLAKEKTLTRKSGRHLPSGAPVHGYEIHHGISNGITSPLLQFDDNTTCGTSHGELHIWGSYLHGIFDADDFRRWYIDNLRQKIGLSRLEKIQAPYNLERAFDTLADIVRENIDMDALYSLIEP
jgi:cobyric acid synthase CobQ/L-threonine-O-3-phosphate decarboxylase